METPMQILLRKIENGDFLDHPKVIGEFIKYNLLKKEKEMIIETSKNSYIAGYLDNQAKIDDSMNFPEDYYNETFNSREK